MIKDFSKMMKILNSLLQHLVEAQDQRFFAAKRLFH